jgi:predicted transcriptional regulator
MATPLDAVDWLTRSENRVEVLELLTEERHERSELQELTGVSRVTSNRMLAELEDRSWIRRDGHSYEITPTGKLVIEALDELLDTIATGQKLGDIQQYLPTEEFGFDLRRLGESRVT